MGVAGRVLSVCIVYLFDAPEWGRLLLFMLTNKSR